MATLLEFAGVHYFTKVSTNDNVVLSLKGKFGCTNECMKETEDTLLAVCLAGWTVVITGHDGSPRASALRATALGLPSWPLGGP
jgi:hypothetical protein